MNKKIEEINESLKGIVTDKIKKKAAILNEEIEKKQKEKKRLEENCRFALKKLGETFQVYASLRKELLALKSSKGVVETTGESYIVPIKVGHIGFEIVFTSYNATIFDSHGESREEREFRKKDEEFIFIVYKENNGKPAAVKRFYNLTTLDIPEFMNYRNRYGTQPNLNNANDFGFEASASDLLFILKNREEIEEKLVEKIVKTGDKNIEEISKKATSFEILNNRFEQFI